MLIRNKRVLKQLQPIVEAISNGTLTCEYGATNLHNQPYKGLNALMLGYKSKKHNVPNLWAMPKELSLCNYVLVDKPTYTLSGAFFKRCQKGMNIDAPITTTNSNDIYHIRRYPNLYNVLDINGFEYSDACKYASEFCEKYSIGSADELLTFVELECFHIPDHLKKVTASILYAYFASYCRINHCHPSIDLSLEDIHLSLEVSSKYAFNIASKLIELCIPDSRDLARQHLTNLAALLKG